MSSACDVLGEGACSRGSVLVQDSLQAPATFMIPLLLKHALKQGDKVVFVAAAQPKSHYKQVMRKMGIDVDASAASGQLEVVAFLSDYPEWRNQQSAAAGPSGCVCQALYAHVASGIVRLCSSSRPGPNNNEAPDVAEAAAASGVAPGGQLTLIIDDISAIAAVAGSSSASRVTRILQSARGLCSNLQAPHRFVCLAHDDSSTEEIDSPWVSRLAAAADAIVKTDHLGGASEDVHGQVSVQHKRAWETGDGTLSQAAAGSSSFYFRLTEGSIRFSAAM